MQQLHVDDHVRLVEDIPELALLRGEVGVVCSMWFEPATAYEVEFMQPDHRATRALVRAEQITVEYIE